MERISLARLTTWQFTVEYWGQEKSARYHDGEALPTSLGEIRILAVRQTGD